ncbi:hypothetical protein KAJ27_05910, partial [bacterium]|nr:hypothetical protein [bacterium]
MKKIITLIYIKYLIFKRRIFKGKKSKFSLLLFITLFTLILGFTFYFCKNIFSYIHDFDETGKLLNLKILEYFTIFLILIDLLSNIIVALNIVLENREFSFLMSFPLSHSSMCMYKAIEICFISNWMAYIIGFTIFISWAIVTGLNLIQFIIVFAILWAFLLFMTSLTAFLLVQIILYIFPIRWISRLIHFAVISISVSIVFILRALKPEKLINPDVRGVLKNYIMELKLPFENFYPTHWMISTFSGNSDLITTIVFFILSILILLGLIVFTG